jgi:hypothetical protein
MWDVGRINGIKTPMKSEKLHVIQDQVMVEFSRLEASTVVAKIGNARWPRCVTGRLPRWVRGMRALRERGALVRAPAKSAEF